MSAAKHDEYLTVDEIAELLKVNPQTVRNWIERRELPAVRVGARRVRVLRADFDRYLAAGSMTAGDEQPQGAAFPVEARDRLAQALESARAALRAGRKADLAIALDALVKATDQVLPVLDNQATPSSFVDAE